MNPLEQISLRIRELDLDYHKLIHFNVVDNFYSIIGFTLHQNHIAELQFVIDRNKKSVNVTMLNENLRRRRIKTIFYSKSKMQTYFWVFFCFHVFETKNFLIKNYTI